MQNINENINRDLNLYIYKNTSNTTIQVKYKNNLDAQMLQDFTDHKTKFQKVLSQISKESNNTFQDCYNWPRGSININERLTFIEKKFSKLQLLYPEGSQNNQLLTLRNKLDTLFMQPHDMERYQTYSTNYVNMLTGDKTNLKQIAIRKISEGKITAKLDQLNNYNLIKKEVWQSFANFSESDLTYLIELCRISELHEFFCLIHIESSVFCGLNLITFVTILHPLHTPGEVINMLVQTKEFFYANNTIRNERLRELNQNNIRRSNFYARRTPEDRFNSTKNFYFSHKKKIIFSVSLGSLALGVKYLANLGFNVGANFFKSLPIEKETIDPWVKSILPIEQIEIVKDNLKFTAHYIARSVSEVAREATRGYMEPWIDEVTKFIKELKKLKK